MKLIFNCMQYYHTAITLQSNKLSWIEGAKKKGF